jgi:hypothetical protein
MSFLSRLVQLSRTPQGRALVKQVAKVARDPKSRERLAALRDRSRSRNQRPAAPEKPEPQVQADARKAGGYGQTGDLGTGTQGSSNIAAQEHEHPDEHDRRV